MTEQLKMKLTPTQADFLADVVKLHLDDEAKEALTVKKTVMVLSADCDQYAVLQKLSRQMLDWYEYLSFEYDNPETVHNEAQRAFALRSLEKSADAMFKKLEALEMQTEQGMDNVVKSLTAFESVAQLEAACEHYTPTLRVNEENARHMHHLHAWMDRNELSYCAV